jgi:hypothetical protein
MVRHHPRELEFLGIELVKRKMPDAIDDLIAPGVSRLLAVEMRFKTV